MKTYTYKGVTYSSQKELCNALKISRFNLIRRLKKGMSLEDAIEKTVRHSYECVDHLGNKYPSMSQMAAEYCLDASVLTYRLERGYSLKDALTSKRVRLSGFKDED